MNRICISSSVKRKTRRDENEQKTDNDSLCRCCYAPVSSCSFCRKHEAENTVAGEITENTAEEEAKDSKAEEVTDECIKASEKA